MLITSLILLQAFIFIGLIIVLRHIMDKNVSSATKHLEELDEEYTRKENEVNRRLDDIKQKSEEMLAQARQEAEKLKEQIAKDTEEEKNKILEESRTQSKDIIKQAEKSKELLLNEINEKILKEAIEKACELMHDILPEQFRQDVHAKWMEDLIETEFGSLQRLPIPKGVSEVKVTSAFKLNESQYNALFKKLKDVLKREPKLKEEVDPKVVAGVVIAIGSLVFDGSLRHKIRQRAKDVQT